MSDINGRRRTVVVADEPIPEGLRVARGQLDTLRFVERQERREQSRPVLELMPDEPEEAA